MVETGRTMLRDVLDTLVQQSRDEQEYVDVEEVDEDVEECARHLLEYSSPRKRFRIDGTHRRKRKRIPKDGGVYGLNDEDLEDGSYNEIVTVYGRHVNLSRLNSDPSLYSLCREWVCDGTMLARELLKASNQQGNNTKDTHQCLPDPTPLTPQDMTYGAPVEQPKISTSAVDAVLVSQPVDMEELKMQNIERWKSSRKRSNHLSMRGWYRYAESWSKLKRLCHQ